MKAVKSTAFVLVEVAAGLALLYGVLVVMTWAYVAAWFYLSNQCAPPPERPIQVVQQPAPAPVPSTLTEPIKEPDNGDTP